MVDEALDAEHALWSSDMMVKLMITGIRSKKRMRKVDVIDLAKRLNISVEMAKKT